MKRLYFIRHGLSVDNKNGIYSGSSDTPLAEEGRLQIQRAAQDMIDLNIDAILSSPFQRTVESAQIIARVINFPIEDIITSDLLAERKLGILEGQLYQPGKLTDDVIGIEKSTDLLKRTQEAFDWIQTINANNILIVSHGSLGRALRATVNPSKYSYIGSRPFLNGDLTILI